MAVEKVVMSSDDAIEAATLECLSRNLPAQSWLENLQSIAHKRSWDIQQRHVVADVLLRLLSIDSMTALVLQYIAFTIDEQGQEDRSRSSICTGTDLCQRILDTGANQLLSNDAFESLVRTIDGSHASIRPVFSVVNCLGGVRLLQTAIASESDSARHLALRILAGLCLELETSRSAVSTSMEQLEECIKSISSSLEGASRTERMILEHLKRLIEAKEGDGLTFSEAKGNNQASSWSEEDSLTFFEEILANSPAKSKIILKSSSSATAISPEMVNLVYFLIDSYSDWQTKIDAVVLVFKACYSDDRAPQHLLYELFFAVASACAIIAGTPTSLGGSESHVSTWRGALCGLTPGIFAAALSKESGTQPPFLAGIDMTAIVKDLLSESSHALLGCEVMLISKEDRKKQSGKEGLGADSEVDMMLDAFIGTDEGPARSPVRATLLRSLQGYQLISQQTMSSLDGVDEIRGDLQDLAASYMEELGEGQSADSSELVSLFEQKLLLEIQEEGELFSRIVEDYACQQAFSLALVKVMSDCISSSELDNLARLCRLLTNDLTILDICLLYVSPQHVLHPIAGLMEEDGNDLLQNGEEPSVLGAILLFAQVIVQKALSANCTAEKLLPPQRFPFMNAWIRSSSNASTLASLGQTDQGIISSWITALFDSDGISDDLIKSSSPSTMLRLTPSLFMQSINACCQGVIDLDTLRGGLTYFLQDLLSYTLPAAINWLLLDLSRGQHEDFNSPFQDETSKAVRRKSRDIRLEVLSMLLISESCPVIVQKLVANGLLEVLKAYHNTSEIAEKLLIATQTHSEPTRLAKTHLWVKISQAQMKSCNVDALLSLDASFDVLRCSRGLTKALHVVKGTLSSYVGSISLCRAVATSLCLAHLQDGPSIALTEDVILYFAHSLFESTYALESTIPSLDLILQMLRSSGDARNFNAIEAIEALTALRIRQLLKRARGKKDVARLHSQFRILLEHTSEQSPLRKILIK